jgi:hypothetical protein
MSNCILTVYADFWQTIVIVDRNGWHVADSMGDSMQAAIGETVSGERKASSLLPMDTLAATIRARVAKGDKATSDADGHYLAAGLLLLEAKRRLPLEQPVLKWTAYLVGTCKVGTTRADELIAIAEERTTLDAQREKNRNRQATFAARNKAARSNVTNVSPSSDPRFGKITKILRDAEPSELPLWEAFASERLSQRTKPPSGALN